MSGIMNALEKIVEGITIPKGQSDRNNDNIMWRQDGPTTRNWGSNKACFGGSMHHGTLTSHRFECRDLVRGRHLPQKVYLGTMRELRSAGLIPPGMRYWIQNKYARFELPPNVFDRHTVFTALSLYRHCDAQPNTMFLAWRLFQRLRDYKIPYLQCLHYALGQLGYCGHTFISMQQYEGASGPLNPGFGWAMAYFGTLNFEDRAMLVPTGVTTSMFTKLAALANPALGPQFMYGSPNPEANRPTEDGVGTPALSVRTPAEILHPQLTPLYTNPQEYRDPKAFVGLVESLCQRPEAGKRATWAKPKWGHRL